MASVENTDAYAAAGVMLRKDLTAGSPFAMALVTPGTGVHFRARASASGAAVNTLGPSSSAPVWLRIVRNGDWIAGYWSSDGLNWTLLGQSTFELGDSLDQVYVGLAVSSADVGNLCTAEFEATTVAYHMPTLGPDLKLWLRADVGITKDGSDKVSFWQDQSGNSNHAVQNTSANQPVHIDNGTHLLGGRPVVQAGGASGLFLSIPDNTSLRPDPPMMFVVGKQAGSATWSVYAIKSASSWVGGGYGMTCRLSGANGGFWVRAYDGGYASSALSADTYYLMAGSYDGANVRFYVDGVNTATRSYSNTINHGSQPFYIGTYNGSASYDTNYIAEILLYDAVLSDAERQEVEAYLANKYGLSALPAAATPSTSIGHGTYASSQSVSITVPPGTVVYYTTNGSEPTEASTLYTGPIMISSTTTLKVKAFRAGYAASPTVTNKYVIDSTTAFTRTGLQLWLRSDEGVEVDGSSKVERWLDQSGKGNHAEAKNGSGTPLGTAERPAPATGGASPMTSSTVISFDGGDYLTVPGNSGLNAGAVTVVAVARITGGASNGRLVSKASGTTGYELMKNTHTTVKFRSETATTYDSATGAITSTPYYVFTGTYGGGTLEFYMDGALVDSKVADMAIDTGELTLGAFRGGGGNKFAGEMVEVLIYDRAITGGERREIEAYLFAKYGIGAQPQAGAPQLDGQSNPPGIYTSGTTVELTAPDAGATIQYTTDDSNPATSGTAQTYSGAIAVNADMTIRAVALKTGYATSEEFKAEYVIDSTTAFTRTGLQVWLRSDEGVEEDGSSKVERWLDQSGNGNHAEAKTAAGAALASTARPAPATGSVSPLTSSPVISFDGGDRLTVFPDTGLDSANFTVVTVGLITGGSSVGRLVSKASGSGGYEFMKNTNTASKFRVRTASAYDTAAATFGSVYRVHAGTFNGSTLEYFMDGALISSISGTMGADSGEISLGSSRGGSNYFAGELVEVLIYNRVLTAPERREIEAYLFAKYGIGAQPQADAPQLGGTNPPGIYSSAPTVTLTAADPGVTIKYTTDDSDPATSGTAQTYTGPFAISATATLRAVAIKSGYATSAEFSARYVVDSTAVFNRDGLQMWLRSDEGVEVDGSGKVERWLDQSTKGNHAEAKNGSGTPLGTAERPAPATGGASPMTSSTVISFDGGDYLTVPGNSGLNAGAVTVVAVARITGGASNGRLVSKASGTTGYELMKHSNVTAKFRSGTATTYDSATGSITSTPYYVFTGTYGGGTLEFYMDGAQVDSKVADMAIDTGELTLGAFRGGGNNKFAGEMVEVLVYNRAITAGERREIELYLYIKYGLGAQPQAAMPQFGVPATTFTDELEVTMTSADAGTIRYTTDGNDPTGSSTVYDPQNPPVITADTTFKARVYKTGFVESAVATSPTYTLDAASTFTRNGLQLWLRSDKGVEVDGSSKVERWLDQSGNGNHAEAKNGSGTPLGTAERPAPATGGASPMTSSTVISFDGGDYLTVPGNSGLNTGAVTVVAVARITGGNSAGRVVSKASGTTGYELLKASHTTMRFRSETGTTYDSATGSISSTPYYVFSGTYGDGTLEFYMDGAQVDSKAAGMTADTGHLTLGADRNGLNKFAGEMVEVLVYDRAITGTERREVEYYLYTKYGIGNPPQAAAPQFGVKATTFSDELEVTMTSADGGTIRYTTDGNDPTGSSTAYDPENPPVITATTTFKARVYKTGYTESAVAISPTYTLDAASVFTRNGLVAWYRADVGLTYDGSNAVSGWIDQSGLGHDAAQGTAANQPARVATGLNNLPTVSFDGSNDWISTPNTAALQVTAPTLYVVATYSNPGNNYGAFVSKANSTGTNGWGLTRLNSGTQAGFWINDRSTKRAAGSITADQWMLAQASYGNGTITLIRNAATVGTYALAEPITYGTEALGVGGTGNSGQYLQGQIAEVLLFNRQLTFAEQVAVEKYLGVKYDLNTDADGDGLPRWLEVELGTDPADADTNNNGLPDGPEYNSGYDPASNDSDGDGVSNTDEYAAGTNAFWADTDGDGVNDGSDAFPFDPNRSSVPSDPTPSVAPTITLELPTNAVLLP